MIQDLLIEVCTLLFSTPVPQDGIFVDETSDYTSIPCRVTNASTRDMQKIQHMIGVDTEVKKMFLEYTEYTTNIQYGWKVRYNDNIYEILNIYKPMDSANIHHIKLLLKRVIQGSSS